MKLTPVVVQRFIQGTTSGEYEGNVAPQLSGGRVQEVDLQLIVDEGRGQASVPVRIGQSDSRPTMLLPRLRTLPNGFSVPAGWPAACRRRYRGNPPKEGSVVIRFSLGADPELRLQSREDGLWQTGAERTSEFSVTVEAFDPQRKLTGRTGVLGEFQGRLGYPGISAVVSAAPPGLSNR